MFVCTEETLKKPGVTPWGAEVQRILAELDRTQVWLAMQLRAKGFERADRPYMTELLQGTGALTTRREAVSAINEILGIPENL